MRAPSCVVVAATVQRIIDRLEPPFMEDAADCFLISDSGFPSGCRANEMNSHVMSLLG